MIGAIIRLLISVQLCTLDCGRIIAVAVIHIHITGNTVIDALLATTARIEEEPALAAGLDMGNGSGPLHHGFAIESEFTQAGENDA